MLMITAFSGTEVLLGTSLLLLGVVVLIIGLRSYFRKGKKDQNTPALAKKYLSANVFRFSGTFFRLGLISALALAFMAFNWTVYEQTAYEQVGDIEDIEDIMVAPPPTDIKPPPPPPPPPPKIEAAEPDEVVEDKVFESTFIDEKTEVVPPTIAEPKIIAPPPPPPPIVNTGPEFFKIVERMPAFGKKCNRIDDKDERQKCSDTEIIRFLNRNLRYPSLAHQNDIEGKAIVRFIVEKDGSVSEIQVLREPGGGIGEEAQRVVELMNDAKYGWTAGKQRGTPVRVQYVLPITFKLQ